MAWYDNLVDWGAEAIGYVDEFDIDGSDLYTAGQQFSEDVSDTFGFIKKPLKAYGMLSGTIGADGKRVAGKQQVFQPTNFKQARSYRGMGFGKTTSPQFQVSQGSTMATGAFNPQVQTAMTALLAGSNNVQMNNLLGSFAVSPNLGQGRKTSTGSTTLARKVKKTK